jgi:CopG family nickel-responsive transcriptional regulator
MAKQGVTRISISLSPNLLADFDEVTSRIGYDRSKAIQQAMRDFISEYQSELDPSITIAGTITIIYDHHTTGLEAQLTNVQHDFARLVTSTTHIHLDHAHCLLVIVVKGRAEEIKELASRLRSIRGIHQLKLTSLLVNKT